MRITIVSGFFLPMPPLAGGATEKSWFRLAREFARQGHEVTIISRTWPGLPREETNDGIRHVRLPGSGHTRYLFANLVHDYRWSRRVTRALPPGEIVVCHAVTLPVWLARKKPGAGKVVVMCGRMPKGQYRWYRGLARVLAPSAPVRDRVTAESPALAPLVRLTGYPIDWQLLQAGPAPGSKNEIAIGYIGRLHREKGLLLLADAVARLAREMNLPPWRFVLGGPADVAHGGSGPEFRAELVRRLSGALGPGRLEVLPAEFDAVRLAAAYRALDVFCYPSLAEAGETFGVAVAEAMAARAVPVVSDLACFREYLEPGHNGAVFDHRAPDAASRLASILGRLVAGPEIRRELSTHACSSVSRFDYPAFAGRLLEDFAVLARG